MKSEKKRECVCSLSYWDKINTFSIKSLIFPCVFLHQFSWLNRYCFTFLHFLSFALISERSNGNDFNDKLVNGIYLYRFFMLISLLEHWMIHKYAPRYWQNNRWDYVKTNDSVTVHPLDGEIYAQIINLSCAYEVHFHGYHEIPDISKQRYSFPADDYTTVELLALEILTSDNAKS